MIQKIETIDDSDFNILKEAVLVNIKKKDITMSAVFNRFWQEIYTHEYIFDRKESPIKPLNISITFRIDNDFI